MKTRPAPFRLIVFATLLFFGTFTKAQTFNLYIINDHLVSPTVFEFDQMIVSTSTDFLFRSIQSAFTFDPGFIPSGATINISLVSSGINNFSVGFIQQNPPPNFAFQAPLNAAAVLPCTLSPVINLTTPLLISTWRLTSNVPFNCQASNISMIWPSDPMLGGNIVLRTIVGKWNTLTCTVPTLSVLLTDSGTYTSFSHGTLTQFENNVYSCDSALTIQDGDYNTKIEFNAHVADKNLHISCSQILKSIQIFSLDGKLIFDLKNFQNDIDLSEFSSGTYIIVANVKDQFLRKLILLN